MYDHDIAVIGGGSGGYVAASYAAQFGKKVVLIEKDKLGGCCLNVGCIPTKVLFEASGRYRRLKTDAAFGIDISGPEFSWDRLKKHSEEIRGGLVKGVSGLLASRKVEIVHAIASLKDEHTIEAGERTISAEYIILATGTKPSIPSVYADIPKVVTSDDFWDIDRLPDSIVIVGGGVIGCEIASALSGLGTKVTVMEQLPRLLTGFSDRAVSMLKTQFEKDGVTVMCDSTVTGIREDNSALIVSAGEGELRCDLVLWAAGRRPVDIDTGSTDIKHTERGYIEVDDNCRTNIENIYCIGDANGISLLAYSASSQAMRAVRHICTGYDEYDEQMIPACVYTYPELAKIGMSEDECMSEGMTVSVGMAPYKALGYAHTTGDEDGYIRVIRDIGTDTLAGAEIAGRDAVELIHILQPYVQRRLPLSMLTDIVPAHPTLSEGIKFAIEASYTGSPQL